MSIYNTTVQDYRRRHRLRSRNHPVPDLATDTDWLEAPFWAWRAGDRQRRRLFARIAGTVVYLRVSAAAAVDLPPFVPTSGGVIPWWHELQQEGWRIRPRALTTTLYARLFLADLFVHGIGGGKYDELTDELMCTFFGLEPPEFLILSGTCLLPLPVFPVTHADRQRLARLLRDLHYNPDRYIDVGQRDSARDLIEQKKAWIARQAIKPAEKRDRFHALRDIAAQLRPMFGERERGVRTDLARCDGLLAANAILQRRDYAFCLYPESVLRPFCQQFLNAKKSTPAG